jgi:GWxTD domain-containing protein
MEILDFSLAPGRFRIEVTVTDSVSGQQLSTGSDLEAYREAPLASDLMLSPGMRLASDGDTMPRVGERRWGNTLVTAAARLRLTPVRTKAYYLLEAYAAQDTPGTMAAVVSDSTGRALVRTRPAAVNVAGGGSVLKGQLDLAGLPAGSYTLTVHLELAGKAEDRADRLVMADFGETMTREAERLEALKASDEGYFAVMNDDQLNEAEAPLSYLAGPEELRVWDQRLGADAKRRFLTDFWQRRDPTPGTIRNETREAFYGLIARANRDYGLGRQSTTAGWRTDRGRVFVKHGAPLDMLDRRVASGKSPPYMVWRYVTGKPLYYIFADRTGFGEYRLLASNDLAEPSQPGFREILGAEALQDISRFLGIDLFLNSGGTGNNPTQ